MTEGGMSAEICFGKYLARQEGAVFQGWKNKIHDISPTTIIDTLEYISTLCSFIRQDAIISPGFLSVPYIAELVNMLYLPSQFLVGVPDIGILGQSIDHAQSKGIDCYAVVGYDAIIPDRMVAWIKFRKLPPQYEIILRDRLCRHVYLMGVWSADNVVGEAINRKYKDHNDIYFTYVNEVYNNPTGDNEIITHFYGNDFTERIEESTCAILGDWESSIDFITDIGQDIIDKLPIKVHVCVSNDTVNLYLLTSILGSMFMKKNGIKRKGTVLNPYIICNPLYEVYYGYLPITYWQMNDNNQNIYKVPETGEVWINLVDNQSACNFYPKEKASTVLTEKDLPDFIEKYRPRDLWSHTFKYLNNIDLLLALSKSNITTI
jgi:hypothetical protein